MHEVVVGKGGLGHYGYREEKSQRHRQEEGGQAWAWLGRPAAGAGAGEW